MDIYIVRHAFASHADFDQWPDDSKRPLTKDGIAEFRAAARGLHKLVPSVDAVLSSGFARAWQTAELLHEEARWPEPEECEALETGRAVSAVIDVLDARSDQAIAVVGHEPYLSMLTSLLCTGRDDVLQLQFKKGGVVLVDVDDAVEPGSARLRWSLPPKILRAIA